MEHHILVPVDDSDRSREAFEYVLKEHADATITVLHVVDPAQYYATGGVDGASFNTLEQLKASFEARGEELLDDMVALADTETVSVETVLAFGPVAETVVSTATELDVDHIIMGSHGRSGASRILLGSVAENVTRRSPVSVTIVR